MTAGILERKIFYANIDHIDVDLNHTRKYVKTNFNLHLPH
jgi:hypothetical protein